MASRIIRPSDAHASGSKHVVIVILGHHVDEILIRIRHFCFKAKPILLISKIYPFPKAQLSHPL